jgi:hypothetical protein
MAAVELAGQAAQPLERLLVVVERPRGAQPPAQGRAVALGQMIEDVALSLKKGGFATRYGRLSPLKGPVGRCRSALFGRLASHTVLELSLLFTSLWAVSRPERNRSWPGQGRWRRAGAQA